ncbi:hypothetical protein DFH28DRAFT_927718 [Melampsora americana]|nr:hypothetical protein DFH28DRAFT_927718 [Melampsora americana]
MLATMYQKGCSASCAGPSTGWPVLLSYCYTICDKIATWVSRKAQLQEIFPAYCQHRSTIDKVNSVVAEAKASINAKPPNQSDIDNKQLGNLLNNHIFQAIGYHPPKGFPCVPNPLSAIEERKIPIIVKRDPNSKMTDKEFAQGFNGMNARAWHHWLADITSNKFRIEQKPPADASGSNDAGPATASNDGQKNEAQGHIGVETSGSTLGDAAQQADVYLDGKAMD